MHPLGEYGEFSASSPPNADAIDILKLPAYEHSFAGIIWNRQSLFATGGENPPGTARVRVVPFRKDSFLLISAGQDGVYGTKDDVTNFD